MTYLDHEVTLLAICCFVKPPMGSIICYYQVFSKYGNVQEKMQTVQRACHWSALPRCRSLVLNLEKGVKYHWRDSFLKHSYLIVVRHSKLTKLGYSEVFVNFLQ